MFSSTEAQTLGEVDWDGGVLGMTADGVKNSDRTQVVVVVR